MKRRYDDESDVNEWLLNSGVLSLVSVALLGPPGLLISYLYLVAALHPAARITRIPETIRLMRDGQEQEYHAPVEDEHITILKQWAKYGTEETKQSARQELDRLGIKY